MAAKDAGDQHRRSDCESVRPEMSELRIVLLGRSGELKSKVGNIILSREAFETQPSFFTGKNLCERARGLVDGRHVTVINTPDLLHPQLPQYEIDEQLELCVSLSDPGPHVLLLVLQPDRFTEKDRDRMKRILAAFGDQEFKYTMVLVTQDDVKDICTDKQKELTALFPEQCRERYQQFNDINKTDSTQITEFIKKMTMIVEENEGTYLTCETYKELETDNPKQQRRRSIDTPPNMAGPERLNLVVFGRGGAGKTFVVNTILGQRDTSVDPSPSSVYESREGEVCGRLVTVVTLPALYEVLPSVSVSRLFTSLGGPGVHAFLLVTPAGPLTDEDKAEIVRIQEIFGTRVADYMIFLFTDDNPAAQTGFDFPQQNKETQELLQTCGNRSYVFNYQEILNDPIIPEILSAVERMNEKIGSCFSLDMYWETQLKNLQAKHKAELEERDRRICDPTVGVAGKDPDCLRILLVGRMGSGKSAAGNTILQREEFLSQSSITSVTTSCKRGVGDVAGRRVAVVDTPGLIDVPHSNEDIQQIIAECFSLLAPGPHVFLLVLQIGRMRSTEEDTLQLMKCIFGKDMGKFIIILFTRGDDLNNETFENYMQSDDSTIQKLIHDCGGRFHVFNNMDNSNLTQVTELLDKIDVMVQKNGGGCYTNEMFQEAERTIKEEYERILREKEGEMEKMKEELNAKHKEEMEEMKRRIKEQQRTVKEERVRREKELKDKEEKIREECEDWTKREQVEKKQREVEEKNKIKQELKRKKRMDEIEKERLRMKEEWKCREEEEKKRLETVENERKELLQKQERGKRELEVKLAEEKKQGDRVEQERRIEEERERKELEERIKEVEKVKKGMQEHMRERDEEWELQREKEQKGAEEKRQKEEKERQELIQKQEREKRELEERLAEEKKQGDREEQERRSQEEGERKELEERMKEVEKEKKGIQEYMRRKDEEWELQREKERKGAEERRQKEEKERQELIQKQEREKRELEERLAEEKKQGDREEQERRSQEEGERKELEERIKDAEKVKKGIQEDMRERDGEWELQREKERKGAEERRQEIDHKRREWGEKQKKMMDEFETEKEQERLKREREKRKEDKMERDLEEKKTQLKKQEEWDKERKEETVKRYKEDEQRREEERKRLAKRQEELEKEQKEENQRRKKEEKSMREREEKEQREIEEDYERKMKEMKSKYEAQARKQAWELEEIKFKSNCTVM